MPMRSVFWWYIWCLYVRKAFIFGTEDRVEKALRARAFKSES
jgi:hypothetical protein